MSRRTTDPRRSRQAPLPTPVRAAPPAPAAAPRQPSRAARSAGPDPVAAVFRALLPLRFFLGAMFLYAGLDKLVDPGFLAASGPGSIGEQLAAFTHVSPLTPLIQVFAEPFPVAVGLAFAVVEIAVGLGVLTGIAYRGSAAVGAALSALFLLTASWDTRPIYYGPDLPYMVGWLTLALAGSGGLYVLEPRLLAWFREGPFQVDVDDTAPASAGRRAVLSAGVVGLFAVAVAVVGRAFGNVVSPLFTQEVAAAPTAAPSPATTTPAASVAGATAGPAATAAAGEIANATSMQARSAADFQLAGGDPGVVVKLSDGKVVAYDATCTHEGCPVGYDPRAGLLLCPCHAAAFDPADGGAVVQGPARRPLAAVPISIDAATGAVTIAG